MTIVHNSTDEHNAKRIVLLLLLLLLLLCEVLRAGMLLKVDVKHVTWSGLVTLPQDEPG